MQTENKLNITAGDWIYSMGGTFDTPSVKVKVNSETLLTIVKCDTSHLRVAAGLINEHLPAGFDSNTDEANALFIADAGTTANKCGLLPSELLKQRNELMEALRKTKEQLFFKIVNEQMSGNDCAKDYAESFAKNQPAILQAESALRSTKQQ